MEERIDYISNEVLPLLQLNIYKNVKIKSIQFIKNEAKTGKDQFQSIAIFGDIILEEEINDIKERLDKRLKDEGSEIKYNKTVVNVVIKMQTCTEFQLRWTNGGLNFYNEILFYKSFINYFKNYVPTIDELFSKLIYGEFNENNERSKDIIILEDLDKYGYRLAKARTFLNLEHILLALRKLGEFHACSYIMKSKDNETFLKKINEFKVVRDLCSEDSFTFLKDTAQRGIKYIKNIERYKNKVNHLNNIFNNLSEYIPKIYEKNDKCVLCHGDFIRNNMLFKYKQRNVANDNEDRMVDTNEKLVSLDMLSDRSSKLLSNYIELNSNDSSEDDVPIDVKFIDLADVVYVNPTIDIAYFLFLNTSQKLREEHWNLMIETYYTALKTETDKYENILVPTLNQIHEDFKINCLMAYFVCSLFLPVMMEKKETVKDIDDNFIDQNRGGDEATKAVGEILIHMLENEFI